MSFALILIAVLWLSWSNGANDNFKGVATIYGSGATSYPVSLAWATATTLAGSVLSVVLAAGLLESFSGGGIVPVELTRSGIFLLSIGIAGASTIFVATLLGMPTSTTHALTGGLIGAELIAAPASVNWTGLWTNFFLPLLASPLMAIGLAAVVYGFLHAARRATGLSYESCVCATCPAETTAATGACVAMSATAAPALIVGETGNCNADPSVVVNVPVRRTLDVAQFISGGAVCFARGLNDTPKIAALLMVAGMLAPWKLWSVALVMAAGGVMGARKVAIVMSQGITPLNAGQGASASLVTAILVLFASRLGLPVSTTHVSCGSLFGIGLASGKANIRTISRILLAWVSTLPVGLALGAGFYWLLLHMGV